ncbi:MAG: ATP-binding cassette domain-containing protein [Acidobacteriota bacterium]
MGHAVAVRLEGLTRRFGEFTAVRAVSLEVAQGEIFGFLGPNGAGKSTTIRMLCGLLAPTSGRGSVAGFDVSAEAEKIKAHIGYMSQRFSLYDDLTVEQNIDFFSGIYRIPKGKREDRKAWVLNMAGLGTLRGRLTGSLPGGWKQRLALGCALLHEPAILFLDEPTSGVDPVSRRNFWDIIHVEADRGTTVFVTTHYMEEAEYCDRLGLIYRGELVAAGTPSEMKERFMGDAVLEVRCDRPQEALAVIEGVEGVKDAALFGRDVHAVVASARDLVPLVRGRLEASGFSVSSIEPVPPSLEDVFVSLIERRDREEASQKEFSQ